jgi:hypothetical protein
MHEPNDVEPRARWWMLALVVLGAAVVAWVHFRLEVSLLYPDGFAPP